MNGLVFHYDNAEALDRKAHKRLLKQWTHTAKAFGIYHLIVIGKKVPQINDAEITIEQFGSYQEVREAHPDEKYVVLTETGKDVDKFKFPKDAFYVLGSNYAEPEIRQGDLTVSIAANIPLWDVVAAGIVLYRRS